MLDVRITAKRYPSRTPGENFLALGNLALSVETGEFACLVGPSGCGKSTLLSIIGGLDQQVEGTVTMDGASTRQGTGFMFQTPRLMPWLTVLDNVRLVLSHDDSAADRARSLLTQMELGDVLDAFPSRLSGGMQRRVALARAFAIEPRVLLLDEPFVSLDLPVANRLRNMLISLWQERGTTILFVTHDLREALALGGRILFMSASPGQIVYQHRIDIARPRTIDDPAVSALQQKLLHDHPDLLAGLLDAGDDH